MDKKEMTLKGVENMAENQQKVFADHGVYFVSYGTIIAFKPWDGSPVLDAGKWNYSKTTSKWRNAFMGETTKETESKIKSGAYLLADLN